MRSLKPEAQRDTWDRSPLHGPPGAEALLEALPGFVREMSVESTDDVEEARDALELSVRLLGQKNPFFDD